MKNIWNNNFYQLSPLFSPITKAFLQLSSNSIDWPTLHEYQLLLDNCKFSIVNHNQQLIKIVPQQDAAVEFCSRYEPMIYYNAEVQTRLESWHDFFQVLVWRCFPKIKATLNALHFNAAKKRIDQDPNSKQRSKLENFLTLFDECGTIIVSSNSNLIDLIKNFQWKKLFLENKTAFSQEIECIVFGHAIYEKAISPYIGMTAQSLFLQQPASFFKLSQEEKNVIVDDEISTLLWQHKDWTSKDLQPLPLLGIPGWHAENKHPDFYDNTNYFRKKSIYTKK